MILDLLEALVLQDQQVLLDQRVNLVLRVLLGLEVHLVSTVILEHLELQGHRALKVIQVLRDSKVHPDQQDLLVLQVQQDQLEEKET